MDSKDDSDNDPDDEPLLVGPEPVIDDSYEDEPVVQNLINMKFAPRVVTGDGDCIEETSFTNAVAALKGRVAAGIK